MSPPFNNYINKYCYTMSILYNVSSRVLFVGVICLHSFKARISDIWPAEETTLVCHPLGWVYIQLKVLMTVQGSCIAANILHCYQMECDITRDSIYMQQSVAQIKQIAKLKWPR